MSGKQAARERSAQNRSLEGGIELLRAFKQGVDMLCNGELAERTGLWKPTISRLTQTLVSGGLLEHVPDQRACPLAARGDRTAADGFAPLSTSCPINAHRRRLLKTHAPERARVRSDATAAAQG